MSNQKIFNYQFTPINNQENYFVNQTNQKAYDFTILDNFDQNIFLFGPKKSGKSHLVNLWKEKNNAVKQTDKKQETFPEFDPLLIEYAIKISPYKKPSIIDSIRILSEPTLSSGAIIFVKIPKERPSHFKALKIIKPLLQLIV